MHSVCNVCAVSFEKNLVEEVGASPCSLYVCLQGPEALPRPQHREESVWMVEVFHYLSSLGSALLAIAQLQVKELITDGTLS